MHRTLLFLGWATAIIIIYATLGAALPVIAKQDLTPRSFSGIGYINDANHTNNRRHDSMYTKCETSWASPTYSEISGLINILKAKTGKCIQKNPVGSKCTTIASYVGADAGLCGLFLESVSCADFAWAIETIRSECGNIAMQRAGGIWYFGQLRAVLF
ncbi:hypothetical protein FN846DRAFT_886597 [Sphaerosporella brunnea]|uniref:Uncharacterized protein n=1 Tax=Sphaerosporella brunnea TaxID=1250544 RepID=A0A5J5F8X5_9PEZI|nr:hypothetical protein FN846DRAFT_886597 [Sphaerosporella brunnea]